MADFSNLVFPFLSYVAPRNPYSYEKIVETNRDAITPWLTLPEIRNQLRLGTDSSQDTFLEQLEISVRMYIENYLNVSLLERTFTAFYSSQLTYSPVYLDLPTGDNVPITISDVSYWNTLTPSILTVIPNEMYQLDETDNRVILFALPSDISRFIANPLQVSFSLSASPIADFPDVRQAGLMYLTHLYSNPGISTTTQMYNVPMAFDSLLFPYRKTIL
jgi:hypothetical protein